MKLSDNSIREFQKMYQKDFNEEITYSEAKEMGENLIRFFEVLIEIKGQQINKTSS